MRSAAEETEILPQLAPASDEPARLDEAKQDRPDDPLRSRPARVRINNAQLQMHRRWWVSNASARPTTLHVHWPHSACGGVSSEKRRRTARAAAASSGLRLSMRSPASAITFSNMSASS